MDKGARYHRCDLQVHTPRDPGWIGPGAATEEERKEYAEELIQGCREHELSAIAITDHHDFTFFPYIRAAAEREPTEVGEPVPEEERIVVFPGLELTLTSPNCQALLILDAGFPDNMLASVLTALALEPVDPALESTGDPERIPQNVVSDLKDLYEKLNHHTYLRGRFIVLPNITEGGHGTLLRKGFGNFYKEMPCVGGYTDGAGDAFGKGNRSIIQGKAREYGFKKIAVIQTSDNRRRDHANLGKHATWIKWSEPTAEALRQACLASESRLSLDEPDLPRAWITGISVSNSSFMGRVRLDLNQQYTTLIGGRGTGKSTILEYLRWGLCDQPVGDEPDTTGVQKKRRSIIEDTLESVEGEVLITFLMDGVEHFLKRNSDSQSLLLKIGGGEFVEASEEEIRSLLPIQAYSQKQLSSVGVRTDELSRFVTAPVRKVLQEIVMELRDLSARLRASYGEVQRRRDIERELAQTEKEIISHEGRLTSLRKGLKGLSHSEQESIALKSKYDNEELILQSLKLEHERRKELVSELVLELEDTGDEGDLDVHNAELIDSIRTAYSRHRERVQRQLKDLQRLFQPVSMKDIGDVIKKWNKLRAGFNKKYEAAKKKAAITETQNLQIQAVEERIAELKEAKIKKARALARLESAEVKYQKLREEWNLLHTRKLETLAMQCERFSSLSNGVIRADVSEGLDVVALKSELKAAFARLNVKESKIENICNYVLAAEDSILAWNTVLKEIESLALCALAAGDPLPTTEALDECAFVKSEKERLADGLKIGTWLDLAVAELEFVPRFEYCRNPKTEEFIAFEDASAGQQATALLTVLLNQGGAPLVIDQPEDDVASKLSSELVSQIWSAKRRRQLIFASHNANFVVNGDAELVVCCDYIRAGDQTGGEIKKLGAIDNPEIKTEITDVTEGGKEAFQLRMEKYGF